MVVVLVVVVVPGRKVNGGNVKGFLVVEVEELTVVVVVVPGKNVKGGSVNGFFVVDVVEVVEVTGRQVSPSPS